MDIFISWSGERSLKVATALRDWLPLVMQSVAPWFSPEDIDKGARWMAELSKKLEKLKMGIICVTPENMLAPWLLFEAGALSKVLDTSFVCPFLFALEPADLQGPLAQFQATRATKDEVRKLLGTISKISDFSPTEAQIDRLLSLTWSDFEEKLSMIQTTLVDQTVRPRQVPELLGEVLERIRSIERQLAERTAKEHSEKREKRGGFGVGVRLSPSNEVRPSLLSVEELKALKNKLDMCLHSLNQRKAINIGDIEDNEKRNVLVAEMDFLKAEIEEIKNIIAANMGESVGILYPDNRDKYSLPG
ncbi:MAG: TIR domain-containing protein [Syntrophales bacterium]|jgi:hypothetical protein|nr:TIR domain-containing protein [Syntrophales bacterium]